MPTSPAQAVCPICEGSGWKPAPEAGGRVTRCDCRLSERNLRLMERARIPRRYEHCELREFDSDFEGADGSLSQARLLAERFVEEYPREKSGLLVVGPIGVGKTHLAVGILRELILHKGIPSLFYDYRELLKQIQNSYNDSVKITELEVLRPVFDAEVLVLDELGAVKPTEWVWDTVSHILNTRYNDKRTTIITTNYRDEPAAGAENAPARSFSQSAQARAAAREETLGDRIGERMRSRLHEMCRRIEMRGRDFRERVHGKSGF